MHLQTDFDTQVGGIAHPPQIDSDIDVVIIGAGFGGIYILHHLRKLGLKCKILEAGTDLGGVWHWNGYPGARVDTDIPIYEYSIPEVWKDWTWSERFPDFNELRKYFDHVERVLDIKKDVVFNTRVTGADFDLNSSQWVVKAENGITTRSPYLVVATGFAAKRHFPDWPGLDSFKGTMHHSSFWPQEGVDVKGKRLAVIGTGSTGVQIAQECAPDAAELFVLQRTPNLALPMQQRKLTAREQDEAKKQYPELYKHRLTTFAGFSFDFDKRLTFDVTPEEREAMYEELWQRGGFNFWLATFNDMLFDLKANREAYNFWAKKTQARIHDPVKRDILAPAEPLHAFGTKRPSLEQDYYEQFNRDTTHIVDVKKNPIKAIEPEGIRLTDGTLLEVDIIALATGFDAVSGGMKNIGLRDTQGTPLSELWKDGIHTYLGMTLNGYPNLFFLYGAHGPTAFSNGPTCVEVQGDWIVDAIIKSRKDGLRTIEPTKEAVAEWREHVKQLSDKTLFPLTDSWYMGSNIPGKPREQLNFAGGFPLYRKDCWATLPEWKGFITTKKASEATEQTASSLKQTVDSLKQRVNGLTH